MTGYDLTFSAPKSVSAVWALGTENFREQVQAAHAAAVRAALRYLDTHAAFSRRGTDGAEQISSDGLAVAVFDHRTSRAGDPQLHSHALVLNKVRCADGGWRTLDGHELFHHKKSAGVLYQAALRAELRGRLGFEFTEVTKNGQAEIAGVPESLLKTWSERTEDIAKEAEPKIGEFENALGRALTSAERIGVTKTAVLKTRPPKEHAAESVLHARWRNEAAELGWDREALWRQITAAAREVRRAQREPESPGWVVANAVTAARRTRAAFSRADLAIEVANRLPTIPLRAKQVPAYLEQLTDTGLTRRGFAVYLGAPRHGDTARASDPRYATPELLDAEARVLDRAEHGRRAGYGLADPTMAERHLQATRLDPDQRAAVLAATTAGDAITVITAAAGAGKTTDHRPRRRRPCLGRLGVHRAGAGAHRPGRRRTRPGHPHARRHRGQMATRPTARGDSGELSGRDGPAAGAAHRADRGRGGDVLHPPLDAITAAAQAARAKVVLVGDPAQIGVVEGPGGLLGALADRIGAAQLSACTGSANPGSAPPPSRCAAATRPC